MEESMRDIIAISGLAAQSAQTIMQAYGFFHLENIKKWSVRLLPYRNILTAIQNDDNLKRDFLIVMDKVAHEAEIEKIEHWKNALLRMATDFRGFSFKSNFIKILQDLTVFDLIVLTKIYDSEFGNENFESELLSFFQKKGASKDFVLLSLKRLASYNLISEVSDRGLEGIKFSDKIKLTPLSFIKNELGKEFIKFITEDFIINDNVNAS